jgi:23S rRNA pseudouridine2605 synthase
VAPETGRETVTETERKRERVQKILARAGIASRRRCEELIAEGRVAINGRTASLGDKADPETDEITLDGQPVPTKTESVYLLMNKPKGYVTTVSDPQGRPTVMDLLPEEIRSTYRLFPVGRLDKDTQGLLILTNDGNLANRLMHPSSEVPKTYVAVIEGRLIPGALSKLSKGVRLDDGMTKPAKVKDFGEDEGRRVLEITIREGRKRQIRRMIRAVGGEVVELVRTAIGPLRIDKLEPGRVRKLTPAEVHALFKAASAKSDAAGTGFRSSRDDRGRVDASAEASGGLKIHAPGPSGQAPLRPHAGGSKASSAFRSNP